MFSFFRNSNSKTSVNTKLSQAIGRVDVDKVKRLLASGQCSLNKDRSEGDSPIIECVSLSNQGDDKEDTRRCEILRLLVQHGADVNVQSVGSDLSGKTAAMVAAERGLSRCLRFLVEAGTDLTIATQHGETALTLAVGGGQVDCVKYLAEHTPASTLNNRNYDGKTALMLAASTSGDSYFLCLQHLLQAGADLNVQDRDGHTALMLAASKGQVDGVKFLTQRMSITTLNRVNDEGKTALMLAASNSGETNLNCLQHLLAAGAEVNKETRSSYTSLLFALKNSFTEAAMLLLEKGAHVNVVSHNGRTPLSFVTGRLDCGIILKLLGCGLDPTLSCEDRYCLHTLVARGLKPAIRGLIMNGFPPLDLDCKSFAMSRLSSKRYQPPSTPMSPLALSMLYQRPDVARYLIANRFFTRFDVVQLPWDAEIRRAMQDEVQNLQRLCERYGGDDYRRWYLQASQCLEILDFLSHQPLSLRNLCVVAISAALSADLARSPSDTVWDKTNWICKPTFKEKIERLDVSAVLKKTMLHQTPSARICCRSWGDIPPGEEAPVPVPESKPCDGDPCEDSNVNM